MKKSVLIILCAVFVLMFFSVGITVNYNSTTGRSIIDVLRQVVFAEAEIEDFGEETAYGKELTGGLNLNPYGDYESPRSLGRLCSPSRSLLANTLLYSRNQDDLANSDTTEGFFPPSGENIFIDGSVITHEAELSNWDVAVHQFPEGAIDKATEVPIIDGENPIYMAMRADYQRQMEATDYTVTGTYAGDSPDDAVAKALYLESVKFFGSSVSGYTNTLNAELTSAEIHTRSCGYIKSYNFEGFERNGDNFESKITIEFGTLVPGLAEEK
jgi:hypothetical protein